MPIVVGESLFFVIAEGSIHELPDAGDLARCQAGRDDGAKDWSTRGAGHWIDHRRCLARRAMIRAWSSTDTA
jgi:hypothetical protein